MPKAPYIGRFAPSPTGELHFGSLVAALGSYLQARSRGGLWLVRIEDIDPPREIPGSAERILDDLHRLGLRPDQPVLYQSSRLPAYREAAEMLRERGHAFICQCSRRMLPSSGIYPGTCRERALADKASRSLRLRVGGQSIGFTDQIMGPFRQDLAASVGDFVIRRADGLAAYQLAVVVDDAHQKVTEVVRGADLLDSTPRQIALQRAFGLPTPGYCHLPVAVLPDGSKLSKRFGSDPVRRGRPERAIFHALEFLGQRPPPGLSLDGLLAWATDHWDPGKIPPCPTRPVPPSVLPA